MVQKKKQVSVIQNIAKSACAISSFITILYTLGVATEARVWLETTMASASASVGDSLSFHHVQFYVDKLQPIENYKSMELRMNTFLDNLHAPLNVVAGKTAWEKMTGEKVDPDKYVSSGQVIDG